MPKPRTKELIVCPHFEWLVGPRGNGVYYADGRSNDVDLGRHSLDTKDRAAALEALKQLDLVKAVETGRADKALLEQDPLTLLKLEEGRKQYLAHVGRAPALGGAEVAPGRLVSPHLQLHVVLLEDVRDADFLAQLFEADPSSHELISFRC